MDSVWFFVSILWFKLNWTTHETTNVSSFYFSLHMYVSSPTTIRSEKCPIQNKNKQNPIIGCCYNAIWVLNPPSYCMEWFNPNYNDGYWIHAFTGKSNSERFKSTSLQIIKSSICLKSKVDSTIRSITISFNRFECFFLCSAFHFNESLWK